MLRMSRVCGNGRFSVYVYDEQGVRHHLAHCQVRWADGDAQVALPSLTVIAGTLPRAARSLLIANLDLICEEWEKKNPGRKIR